MEHIATGGKKKTDKQKNPKTSQKKTQGLHLTIVSLAN